MLLSIPQPLKLLSKDVPSHLGRFIRWFVDCSACGLLFSKVKKEKQKKLYPLSKKLVLPSELYFTFHITWHGNYILTGFKFCLLNLLKWLCCFDFCYVICSTSILLICTGSISWCCFIDLLFCYSVVFWLLSQCSVVPPLFWCSVSVPMFRCCSVFCVVPCSIVPGFIACPVIIGLAQIFTVIAWISFVVGMNKHIHLLRHHLVSGAKP